MVALSYFFESAASSIELIAALSVAAVDMAVDTPVSFSEPMKKGVTLSSATMNFTSAAAGTTNAARVARAAVRRTQEESYKARKREERERGREYVMIVSFRGEGSNSFTFWIACCFFVSADTRHHVD